MNPESASTNGPSSGLAWAPSHRPLHPPDAVVAIPVVGYPMGAQASNAAQAVTAARFFFDGLQRPFLSA
jgi:hypothetical protein